MYALVYGCGHFDLHLLANPMELSVLDYTQRAHDIIYNKVLEWLHHGFKMTDVSIATIVLLCCWSCWSCG